MKNRSAGYFIFIFLIFALARTAHAITAPEFPSCLSPEGTQIVSYSTGSHAIVGKYDTSVTGSDSVYTIDDRKTIQCLCTSDGTGIQTNWWKSSSITDDDRKVLESLGWIYVPNGSLWGLDDSAYFAQNVTYSCTTPTVTPTPDPGSSTPAPTNTPSNTSNQSNTNSGSSSTTSSQGQVLGASTGDVLGFATTGNTVATILAGTASILCFVIWSFISKYGHKKTL